MRFDREARRNFKYGGAPPSPLHTEVFDVGLEHVIESVESVIEFIQIRDRGRNFVVGTLLYGSWFFRDAHRGSDIDLRLVIRNERDRPNDDMEVFKYLKVGYSLNVGNDPFFADVDDNEDIIFQWRCGVIKGDFTVISPYQWVHDRYKRFCWAKDMPLDELRKKGFTLPCDQD